MKQYGFALLALLGACAPASCLPARAALTRTQPEAVATDDPPAVSGIDESQIYGGCSSGVIWAFGYRSADGRYFGGVSGTITVEVDGVVVRSYQPAVIADGTALDEVTKIAERTQAGQWVTDDAPHTWQVTTTDPAFSKSGAYACAPAPTTVPFEINHPADADGAFDPRMRTEP